MSSDRKGTHASTSCTSQHTKLPTPNSWYALLPVVERMTTFHDTLEGLSAQLFRIHVAITIATVASLRDLLFSFQIKWHLRKGPLLPSATAKDKAARGLPRNGIEHAEMAVWVRGMAPIIEKRKSVFVIPYSSDSPP